MFHAKKNSSGPTMEPDSAREAPRAPRIGRRVNQKTGSPTPASGPIMPTLTPWMAGSSTGAPLARSSSRARVILLCNGLVLLKTYLLTVIMLAHRPRVSMSPYLFHPLAIVAVVTSKPLATTHAELNNNCKLKLQIHPTRLFYKTHCLDDQQSHQALTLNSFPANLRDCLRQLSIMRNQQ